MGSRLDYEARIPPQTTWLWVRLHLNSDLDLIIIENKIWMKWISIASSQSLYIVEIILSLVGRWSGWLDSMIIVSPHPSTMHHAPEHISQKILYH